MSFDVGTNGLLIGKAPQERILSKKLRGGISLNELNLGDNMRLGRFVLAATTLLALSLSASATEVSAGGTGTVGTLTDLGLFSAGTYVITGRGVVGLVPDNSFPMLPDGTPQSPITTPNYSYFNPSGSFIADNSYGAAGTNAKIGALIGTFSAAPSSSSDWFLIGYSKQVTLSSAEHIFASVNDTYHDNDHGYFDVHVAAVPEPETYAMMMAGLGLMGFIARRKKNQAAA